ncbi:MAG: GAF domain-containing protein, partial [Candidatus Krumholzibacteria bacterium]|nr:GAF domain-containing protein [Candidatus Krumholzibacteria bacterium]
IAGWAAEHREALLLGHQDDFGKYPGLKLNDPSIISAMVVPIIVRDELVGVINITALSKDVLYNEEDLRALQVFAENAGTCIRHTEQANWLRTLVPNLQKAEQERDKQKSAQSSYKSSKRSI